MPTRIIENPDTFGIKIRQRLASWQRFLKIALTQKNTQPTFIDEYLSY
jgi:hypothetical protein